MDAGITRDMKRDDAGSWVARGAAFGVGFVFGVPMLLGVGALVLLYTATHWYLVLWSRSLWSPGFYPLCSRRSVLIANAIEWRLERRIKSISKSILRSGIQAALFAMKDFQLLQSGIVIWWKGFNAVEMPATT